MITKDTEKPVIQSKRKANTCIAQKNRGNMYVWESHWFSYCNRTYSQSPPCNYRHVISGRQHGQSALVDTQLCSIGNPRIWLVLPLFSIRARSSLTGSLSWFLALKSTVLLVLDCNPSEFLLKQLDYSPSFSMSDSQLSYASLTICS